MVPAEVAHTMLAAIRITWESVLNVGLLILFGAAASWLLWRSFKRSDDQPGLLFKWALSAVGGYFLFKLGRGLAATLDEGLDIGAAFFYAISAAALGLCFAVLWRRTLAELIAKPFGALYDGGNAAPDPTPAYSAAIAKRKRGDFLGARQDVREQLRRFPTDVTGQMLLAEIEAQDLKDLPAAEIVVQRFVNQPGHTPTNIAYALNSMADWQLKFAQDRDAAQVCLERIIELLPDTEWALRASQRIAHLGTLDLLLGTEGRRTFKVEPAVGDLGLRPTPTGGPPAEPDGAALAAQYVRHLEQFPHDTEVREKLAQLYAGHYSRLDLAEGQLEQLIQYPNQPVKQVVRWLNLLADLQVQHGGSLETVRSTLQRIVDRFPDTAAATMAQSRLEHLPLEFRGKTKSQAVTLGSYEDDLGLKGRLPD
jgi:TolA-binding protein